MGHEVCSFSSNRLCSLFYRMVYVVLLLSAVVRPCHAQQVKEFSRDEEPPKAGPGAVIKQTEVYWHNSNFRLDLDASGKSWSVLVQPNSGSVDRVQLPYVITYVDAIHLAAPHRAVLLAELSAGARYVGIIAIKPAQMIDSFWTSGRLALSPNNRYVLFVRFYPAHGADNYDDQYRLYDVLGTRSSNWPKRPAQDAPPTEPVNYDESLAGMPVYPLKADEVNRENTNVPDGQEHQSASEFHWSDDSSKVLFADVQGRIITLVVVYPSMGGKGETRTLVHSLVGPENVCLNDGGCDFGSIRSLNWNGESVTADLLVRPATGETSEMSLTIPLSKFVAAPR